MSSSRQNSIFVYDIHYEKEKNHVVFFGKNSLSQTTCWRWINLPHSIIHLQLNNEASSAADNLQIKKEDLIDFYPALRDAQFTFDPVPRRMNVAPVISFDAQQQRDTPLYVTAEDSAHTDELLRHEPLSAKVITVTVWSYQKTKKNKEPVITYEQSLSETPINRQSILFSLAWIQTLTMMEYIILKHEIRTCEWLTVPSPKIRKISTQSSHITGLGINHELVISYQQIHDKIEVNKLLASAPLPPLLDVVSVDYNVDHPHVFSVMCGLWNTETCSMEMNELKNSYFYEYRPTSTLTTPISSSSSSSSSSNNLSSTLSNNNKTSLRERILLPTILTEYSEFERACENAIKTCLNVNGLPNIIVTYRQHETFEFVSARKGLLTQHKPVLDSGKNIYNSPFGILWCETSQLFKKPALMEQSARHSHSLPRLYAHYLDPSIHPNHFALINWSLLKRLETWIFLLECSRFTHCLLQTVMDFHPSQMNMWQLLSEAYKENFIIRKISLDHPTTEHHNDENDNDDERDDYRRTGGLQLKVRPTVFTHVVEVDWQSCYPQLFDKCNLDYSNMRLHALLQYQEHQISDLDKILCPSPNKMRGNLLPELFRRSIELRREHRISNPTKANAIKQITNFLYGLLWQPSFRFYHPHFCQYVVSIQRAVLLETKRLVETNDITSLCSNEYERIKCHVIGGHTDSIMIHMTGGEDHDKDQMTCLEQWADSVNEHIQQRFPMLSCTPAHIFAMMSTIDMNLYCGMTLDLEFITKGCSPNQFGVAKFVDTFREKLLLDILTCFHPHNGQPITGRDKVPRQRFFQRFLIHLEELVKRFSRKQNQFNYELLMDELVICLRLNKSHLIYSLDHTPYHQAEQKNIVQNPAFMAAQYLTFLDQEKKCMVKRHFQQGDVMEFVMVRDFTNHPFPTSMPVEMARNFPVDIYWYFTKHLLTHIYPILKKLNLYNEEFELEDLLKSFMKKQDQE